MCQNLSIHNDKKCAVFNAHIIYVIYAYELKKPYLKKISAKNDKNCYKYDKNCY